MKNLTPTCDSREQLTAPNGVVSSDLLARHLYHEQDGVRIYCADNRVLLPALGEYDLLLTDPPYGLKWGGTGFANQPLLDHEEAAAWDERPSDDTLKTAMGKCRQHIIWGGNYLADSLGACRGPLVWNKLTGNNSFADGEMAWSDVAGTMRIFTHQWCGAFKDSERGERAQHPTQKPVALMRWCLDKADDPKTILDPWCGSGTTLLAARAKGLKADGIEINERYCEIAKRRLAQGELLAC